MLTADGLQFDDALIERGIIQAIEQSDLRPLQKNRYLRIMTSPLRKAAKNRIVDQVKIELLDNDVLSVGSDGVMKSLSFAAILEIIIQMIPIILAFLELFS